MLEAFLCLNPQPQFISGDSGTLVLDVLYSPASSWAVTVPYNITIQPGRFQRATGSIVRSADTGSSRQAKLQGKFDLIAFSAFDI